MFKKYQSIILFLVSVLAVFVVVKYENKYFQKNNDKKEIEIKEEEIKKEGFVLENIFPKTKLILKEDIDIKRGESCKWLLQDSTACGVYINRRFLSKKLEKGTELNVQWVTNKRYLLPGLVFSLEDQDTIISTKTNYGLDVYIVIIQGQNLKIIDKKNKSYYDGESLSNATLQDLKKFFEIKQD